MLKKIITNPFVFFPLITAIIFWPLSFHLFTLKNDALTYYYPIRTLISDALNNKELPLWTPFINMGYPLHADMQSGAFNPVIWIFSFCTNYSLYGFHLEFLSYLTFAGIGFYFLCKEFGYSHYTSLIIGLAYEFSGFMTDSVQFFVCISAACYVPFIIIYFKRMSTNYRVKDSILTGLFLFLLFTGSYPALFIINVYFLVAFTLFTFFSHPTKWKYITTISLPLVIVFCTFILLSLPAIISFFNHLPFIERGKKQSLEFAQQNSLSAYSIISFISPFSTSANENWFKTDPLMRSSYIGIIPLLFLLYALTNKSFLKVKNNLFFLITGIVMFSLALGNHFFLHRLAYTILPLVNTFRHPALFRLFGIFSLLLVAGYAMNDVENSTDPAKLKRLKKLTFYSLLTLLLIAIILSLILKNQIIIKPAFSLNNITTLFTQLNFIQRFLLQLPIVLLLLLLLYFTLPYKKTVQILLLFCITDFFITTQYSLPTTIIGAKKFTSVSGLLNRNMEKFPLPKMSSIHANIFNSLDNLQLTGSKLPFTKQIGRNDYFITPGNLSSQDKFYVSAVKEKVFKNPIIYFADTILYNFQVQHLLTDAFAIEDSEASNLNRFVIGQHSTNDAIHITNFSANSISCEVNNTYPSTIVYLQNFYPGWKAFIDEKPITIQKANITFMAINLPSGSHLLKFKYDPQVVKYTWYISLSFMLLILLYLGTCFVVQFFNTHNYRNPERQPE